MSFLKKLSLKLGKSLSPNEMKQIKGGESYGCGPCNGEYFRPLCENDGYIWSSCYCLATGSTVGC